MKNIINHFDGVLYVGMAVCTTATALLETADAVQFVSPKHLFVARSFFEMIGAACLAAKTYRSTTFANKQKQDEDANVIQSTASTVRTAAPGEPAKSETVTETVVAGKPAPAPASIPPFWNPTPPHVEFSPLTPATEPVTVNPKLKPMDGIGSP